jgi:opacity protein-like surface antigen
MPIVEERGLIPEISVGGGYNYLRANLGFQGILGGDLNIGTFEHPDPDNPAVYNVTMADPTVNYEWQANVIDLKAQVSKGLLFFRPYAGVGASLGFGRAGSGFESELEGITDDDIALINQAAELLGNDAVIPELSGTSFYLSAPMTGGWSFRAFGGVSINLLIVKIDINAMYDFIAQNYGATVGLRIQL